MKRRSKQHELPAIIKAFAVMSVLSLLTVILYFKERK